MKKILKRATACLLAILMLAGEAPVQRVFAAEAVQPETEQQVEEVNEAESVETTEKRRRLRRNNRLEKQRQQQKSTKKQK